MGDGIIMMRGVVFSEVGCVLMASWEVGWELMVFATVDAVVVSGVVVSVEGVISCGVRMAKSGNPGNPEIRNRKTE